MHAKHPKAAATATFRRGLDPDDKSPERIYNLFVDVDSGLVHNVGAVEYTRSGSDEGKIDFLRSRVASDYATAPRFPIPNSVMSNGVQPVGDGNALTWEDYCMLTSIRGQGILFESVFSAFNAPLKPLMVVTSIIDGKPVVQGIAPIINSTAVPRSVKVEIQPHFLDRYYGDGTFHFNQLINDDHFEAIKTLFHQGFYIAATKLLFTSIDTFGYLACGNAHDSFKRYVDQYFNLQLLEVSSEELWELRNALLHTTSYDSHKVTQGKVRRLIIAVGPFPEGSPTESFEGKNLDIRALILEAARSTERWGNSLFANHALLEQFLARYEAIISETRMTKFHFS